ncbi:MAG: hypothetical protein ABSD75_30195 [Terriglobales bacterium]
MRNKKWIGPVLCAGLLMGVAESHAASDGSCSSYTWDVGKERALFAAVPAVVIASQEMTNAPRIQLGQLYQVQLSAKKQIGRLPNDPPRPVTYGGIASIQIATSGIYRLVMDNNAWVGMTSGISAEVPSAWQAALACKAPSKLVEFRLEAGKTYSVLISGAPEATMRFAITQSPPRS